jgi:Na+-driven multidrug efflux pump
MELNLFLRIIILFVLTVALYILLGKGSRYNTKRKRNLYIRSAIVTVIVLIPPILYFILPKNVSNVIKFYLIFISSVLIFSGLIIFFIIEKKKNKKQ